MAAALVLRPSALMLGPWGLLPFAVPCALFVAMRLGALAFPEGRGSDRAVAGCLLSAALVLSMVRVLGVFHALAGLPLLGLLAGAALVLALITHRPRTVVPWSQLASRATVPVLVAAAVALGIACVAAFWLPVWQWDSLGYHLPYVNFVLVGRTLDAVPRDMPYVSTYPHNGELLMVALRAMLPDDRLVDAAQIPCGVFGAIATAGIARRCGAPRAFAFAAGASWVLAPAVFLQLPTNYVDVASAAFFLAGIYFVVSASMEPGGGVSTRKALVLGGLAIGLYLGTKPNTPLSAGIAAVLLLWVGLRAGERGAVIVGLVLVLFGFETFVVNCLHFGNPVWPVRVEVGPWTLPGKESMAHLLASGAMAPHLHGSLPSRVLRSWTSLTSPPVFDMRIGGFGPIVLAAMPAALVTLARRKDLVLWGALLAAVATPDPSVARYVLALPALVLAIAAPRAAALPSRWRPWLGALVGVLGAVQIAYALPGLTGEGPPLTAYAGMTDDQRAQAVGADGPPTPFLQARSAIRPGETFVFDQSMELPYLAWERDLRYRAEWIPDSLQTPGAVQDFLESENARVVAVAEDSPTGRWLNENPERFLKLFQCKSAPCSVYARR
jgi:hypothetical protein